MLSLYQNSSLGSKKALNIDSSQASLAVTKAKTIKEWTERKQVNVASAQDLVVEGDQVKSPPLMIEARRNSEMSPVTKDV